MTAQAELEAVAKEVITSLSNHSQIPTFSSRPGGLTLAQAYRVTPLLRAAFEARGERNRSENRFYKPSNVEGIWR
jgi:2-oxo-3-hexenedioate decarboxylase